MDSTSTPPNSRRATNRSGDAAAVAADETARVSAALNGDATAMKCLVERLMPWVRVHVKLALLRWRPLVAGRSLEHAVDDLTQDVFVALLARGAHGLRNWCPARGLSLRSYVALVAKRQVGMTFRSRRRNPFTEIATDSEQLQAAHVRCVSNVANMVDREAVRIEHRDQLRGLLALLHGRLSERGFAIFERLYFDECTIDEAALLTGLSPGALYAWRSRIARHARQLAALGP